jgi:uncharacterized repeat protein (TIGR03803 family)
MRNGLATALSCILAIVAIVSRSSAAAPSSDERVLYSFGGPDGAGPLWGVVGDHAGDLFAATVFGGPKGLGDVVELTPGPSGYTETVLNDFRGRDDGEKPTGIVRDAAGDIFGFAAIGGSGGGGTVFELIPNGVGYRFRLLYSFPRSFYAWGPLGAPALGSDGSLFGVTQGGAQDNDSIVFKLTRSTDDAYSFSTLYTFAGGTDGQLPQVGLTIDDRDVIYGTTYYGGDPSCSGGCGEVFSISPTMRGYRERAVYRFKSVADGENPYGPLTIDETTGDIYGTTEYGGKSICGTVFRLSPGSERYAHTVLYGFSGGVTGCLPQGQVFVERDGVLFGTTAIHGVRCSGVGCGLVYELIPIRNGYSHRNFYDFLGPQNGKFDGAEPEQTTLIQDATGALYGTTRSGGSKTNCADGGPGGALGCGTVFELRP